MFELAPPEARNRGHKGALAAAERSRPVITIGVTGADPDRQPSKALAKAHRQGDMRIAEYQRRAKATQNYPIVLKGGEYYYGALAISTEAAEFANKLLKFERGVVVDKGLMMEEVGDVLWHIAGFATDFHVRLERAASVGLLVRGVSNAVGPGEVKTIGLDAFQSLVRGDTRIIEHNGTDEGLRVVAHGIVLDIQHQAEAVMRVEEVRGKDLTQPIGMLLVKTADLAASLGYWLAQIARQNLSKLESRQQRGTIHGVGDVR